MLDLLLADLQLLSGPASPISVVRAAASSASGLLRLLQQKPAVDMATTQRAIPICRAIEISTAALSAAACVPAITIAGEDTRPLWTQLRVDALMCLLEAASSEERCLALIEQTEGDGSVGVASSCLLVLAAAAMEQPCATPNKVVEAAAENDAGNELLPDGALTLTWPGHALEVAVDGEAVGLSTLLRRLVAAGSLSADECAPMLAVVCGVYSSPHRLRRTLHA